MIRLLKIAYLKAKLFFLHNRYINKTDKDIRSIEKRLGILKDMLFLSEQLEDNKLSIETININQYSLLANGELYLFIERASISSRDFEILLQTRVMAVIIIGYLKDINSMIGGKLLPLIRASNYADTANKFLEINENFSKIKNKNDKMLSFLRNKTSAHKIRNSQRLIENISVIDYGKVKDIAFEVIEVNSELERVCEELIEKIIADLESAIRPNALTA